MHETSLQCRVGFRSFVFKFSESHLDAQKNGFMHALKGFKKRLRLGFRQQITACLSMYGILFLKCNAECVSCIFFRNALGVLKWRNNKVRNLEFTTDQGKLENL